MLLLLCLVLRVFVFFPRCGFRCWERFFFSQLGLLMVIFCLFGWFGCSCFFFFLVLFRFVISAGNYYVPREMRVQFTRCFASRICEIFFLLERDFSIYFEGLLWFEFFLWGSPRDHNLIPHFPLGRTPRGIFSNPEQI